MVTKYTNPLGSPGSLRKVHRALALQEIYRLPGSSRREIADRLGLSKMAIGRIVQDLKNAGLLREVPVQCPTSGRGRPHIALELQASGAYVIGVVISGFSQQIVALNLRGDVVASCDVEFSDISDGPQCVEQACEQINYFVEHAAFPVNRIVGAGFSCAVGVDSDNGYVTSEGYLGWEAFDFKTLASDRLNLPVNLVNIADALLRAENFFGCARDTSSAVLVHCSTGLATSFCSNGKLFKGARHQSGRLGHFPSVTTNLTCSCGGSNCLNCSASGWSALHRLGIVSSPVYQPHQTQTYAIKLRQMLHAAETDQNESAHLKYPSKSTIEHVLRECGGGLAESLCLLELTLDPDVLILAGSLAANDDYYDGVIAGLGASSHFSANLVDKISRSHLQPVIGAGLTALLETVFAPEFDFHRFDKSATKEIEHEGVTI